MAGYARLSWLFLTPLHPACSRRLSTSLLSRLTTRRCPSASLRLRVNPVGLRPSWALPFAPVHPRGGGVRTLRVSQSFAARRRRKKILSCVFRGHAPRKTLCSWKIGRQFRRNRVLFSMHPLKKVQGFFEKARTLPCCHATPPSADARFPYDSEQPWRAMPACHGYSSLQSNRAAPGASHFFIVTPHLLTTPGFPPTQGKPGRALPALGFALRSGPSGLFRGLRTSVMSRLAPLRHA